MRLGRRDLQDTGLLRLLLSLVVLHGAHDNHLIVSPAGKIDRGSGRLLGRTNRLLILAELLRVHQMLLG